MKHSQLVDLIQKNIPQITFIDEDITDMIEGECTLWQQEHCTILLDINGLLRGDALLQTIASVFNQLNAAQNQLLQTLQEKTNWQPENIAIAYLALSIQDNDLFGDLAFIKTGNEQEEALFSLDGIGQAWQFEGIERVD